MLHFRSPALTGTYHAEGRFRPSPSIDGVYRYRVRAWGTVYQHEGSRPGANLGGKGSGRALIPDGQGSEPEVR